MESNLQQLAVDNLQALRNNLYPGRLIVIGTNHDNSHIIQAYAIMGRSENSRNRIFDVDHESGTVSTEPADPAKVKDPSLIIYDAMLEAAPYYAVSNGNQTYEALVCGEAEIGLASERFLREWEFEPDEPNYTPRITAVSRLDTNTLSYVHELLILRKSKFDLSCDALFYRYEHIMPGFGFTFHTYSGDGNPLPSFAGEPYLLPLEGDNTDILNTLWDALNPENRISLAVKFIEIKSGESEILHTNQYKKVGA